MASCAAVAVPEGHYDMPQDSDSQLLLNNNSATASQTLLDQKLASAAAVQKRTALTSSGAVIVFDWDDTLLPSSFVSSRGLKLDDATTPAADIAELQPVEEAAASLLATAVQHGPVYIVTNAEIGWVELSAAKWMPKVVPLLAHLTVISARSTFEADYPSSPLDWKLQSFYGVVDKYAAVDSMSLEEEEGASGPTPRSLLSLGDSVHEREAAHAAVLDTRLNVTTVKFIERPSPVQLRREIQQVNSWFSHLLSYGRDLDLVV